MGPMHLTLLCIHSLCTESLRRMCWGWQFTFMMIYISMLFHSLTFVILLALNSVQYYKMAPYVFWTLFLFIIPLFRPEYVFQVWQWAQRSFFKFSTANFKVNIHAKCYTNVFLAFFMYFPKMFGLKDLVTPRFCSVVKTTPTENAQI
jgi:hypothetical protein